MALGTKEGKDGTLIYSLPRDATQSAVACYATVCRLMSVCNVEV